jgi:hypothetical protein
MNPIKKMIIEEAVNVLREVKQKKSIKKLTHDLYEAVQTAKAVKGNPKKHKIAKKIISIAESKLLKNLRLMKENHGLEDESEMAKAQLLSIMESAKELYQMIGNNVQLEDWIQYKLSIAENYMDAIHGYMKYFNGANDMEYNMEDEMDGEKEWDDVEEEDFDEEFGDEEYYDVEDFEDEEDYYDEDDFEDDEEYFSEKGNI